VNQERINPTIERFVSAQAAAEFLSVPKRFLLSLARKGILGAYPIGTGEQRKTWVFKLSELSSAIAPKRYDPIRRFPLK
jgi:hypothetical protein